MNSLKRPHDADDASTLQQSQSSSRPSSQLQLQPLPPSSQTQPQASPSRAKRRKLAGEKDPLDHLYEDIVTIYVGPDATPLHVYKELVRQDSSFFKAALGGSFLEGERQTVSLPEDEVPVVKVYQT